VDSPERAEGATDDCMSQRHSFIVRVWTDRSGEHVERWIWQGNVTHVPSGDCRPIRTLEDVLVFISTHLERAGIRMPRTGRFWRRIVRQ
jgi:hypothetical protein